MKTFTLVSFLACACGFAAHAESSSTSALPAASLESSPKRPLKGEWKFGVGGTTYAEDRDEGAAAELLFSTKLDYQFNKILRAHLEPEAVLYAGRLQERYDNDNYQSRVGLVEGYLALKPIRYFEARAGAIGQEFLDNVFLISKHRAFPGAYEAVMSDTKPVSVSLVAQQTIPTSYTLNTERTEKEALPLFQTQSLHLDGEHDEFDWHGSIGHYSWSNLPDKIAFESVRAGNTCDEPVQGDGKTCSTAPGSRLRYKFDGFFAHAEAEFLKREPVGLAVFYWRNRNAQAPGESADAESYGLGPRLRFGDTEVELNYYRFFVESDVTVNRYLPGSLGYGNRMGDRVELVVHFRDDKFRIKGNWTNALTVAGRDSQQTMTSVFLGVETDYASF